MELLDSVLTLLSSNWDSTNTDKETPVFKKVFDVKRFDLGVKAVILLYQVSDIPAPNGIGHTSDMEAQSISIDIRTMSTRAHSIKLRDEVKRIIKGKMTYPVTGFDECQIQRITDLSDKTIKLFRFVIDVEFKALNQIITPL